MFDFIKRLKNRFLENNILADPPTFWTWLQHKYDQMERPIKFFFQRRIRGFSDDETWSLDYEMSQWIAPRLRRFKELNCGFPGGLTSEEWDKILDEMIWTFEFYGSDDSFCNPDEELYKRADKGMKLFRKYFRNLWW
jgi:hypothetical protein